MQQKFPISYFRCGMPYIGFYKIPMCVGSQCVYCLGSFHQKRDGCLLPFISVKNIGKTLNLIILPSKFASTLCTLNLDVAQFPNVTESNIQMRNTCPSEARFMITNFENNPKNPKIMKCSKTVPKQCKFTKTNKLLQTNLNPLKHPLCYC
jgi:hypothetical protein